MATKLLNSSNVNKNVQKMQFRMRDEVVEKAFHYKKLLEESQDANLPFSDLIFFNIGDAHVAGQKPISFYRQVLACVAYPALMTQEGVNFPSDIIERAQAILKASNGLGSYSGAQGLLYARQAAAKFIERRDGFPSDPNNILMTDGGYDAFKYAMQLIIRDEKDTILAPYPQYPLYSALSAELGGSHRTYLLEDRHGFQPQMDVLQETYDKAKAEGLNVRAIVINNPGNPGGNMLSTETLEHLIRFCEKNQLIALADEVYQGNSYDTKSPFVSLRKVSKSLKSNVELFSFHSTSKGYSAECGVRGGYVEMDNIDPDVVKLAIKIGSARLSPNTTGQVIMALQCDPPREGDPSYPLFKKESQDIMESLARKAKSITDQFNSMTNTSCSPVIGSLFGFPQIHLPKKAIEAAKAANIAPDTFYAEKLLDQTGVCVSSGNIFGQKEGTFHIRLTLMPTEEKVKVALDRIRKFNEDFMKQYQD